ncbi:MAG: gp156 [uncultured marine phage]|uniref:Gp156 n=1 Tax=uncultured marine phage TaxID=707152 RepID=A0A8D9CBZ8_9VIRU|nr:MAG: gp156 [uncultured marine phage]
MKIDKNKALKKWTPVLENMGVQDAERLDWMSEYAEMHSINENIQTAGISYANQGNVAGMGNVVSAQPGSTPGATITTGQGTSGSGDYGQQLLPVAMKIAAHTIGLDLVSVKPSPGPKIDLMYIDFRYDDTPDDGCEKPLVWKVNLSDATDRATFYAYLRSILTAMGVTETVGGLTSNVFLNLTGTGATATGTNSSESALDALPAGSREGVVEFLGFSRIDGFPMFRSYRQTNDTSSLDHQGTGTWGFNDALNTFDYTQSISDVVDAGFEDPSSVTVSPAGPTGTLAATGTIAIELISALEDHIPGYVTNFSDNDAPMRRGVDDMAYPGIIAPDVSTKTIAVGTIEISTALKRTEIEDIKANTGMDIVQKMESILVNELSQTISKQIVNKVFAMGELNRQSAPVRTTTNIANSTIFDYDVQDHAALLGGETSHAVQRKLISKILNASNYIATEGRVGPAQYVVTNGNIAAALQDISGYTINPMKSKLNGTGQLYPVGQIGDVSIYVDPYMKYDDNRILVGRKNQPDQPGIVFIPYLMAQSISIISEATFAPRMLLRSRYAVGELGWYPQKQYMTIYVADPDQILV